MEDILSIVFLQLFVKDVLSCMCVNKFFNNCCSQNIWRNLVIRDFPDISIFKINYYGTYKLCFKLDKLAKSMEYNYGIR